MQVIRPSGRVLPYAVFTAFFLGYLACGYYMAQVLHVYHNDAVARTALAFFTSFGREPHFTAIGFVWQPLPSMLQIPLLWVLWPHGLQMMAGPITSSILGALSVVLIYKLSFYITGRSSNGALFIAVLYGLNPMVLLYTAIGANEIIFMATLIVFVYSLVKWHLFGRSHDFFIAALAIAVSFGSRYESIPAFVAGFLLIALIAGTKYRKKWWATEGILISYSTPFLSAVGVWIGVNWLIMGNPFFFINGEYSNASFTEGIKENPGLMEHSYKSVIKSAEYVFMRVAFLAPALVLLPAIFLPHTDKKHGRDTKLYIALFTPFLMIILFHMYQLYKGDSLGWLRFFMYAIPAATFLLLYINARIRYLIPLSLMLTIAAFVTTAYAMSNFRVGKEEYTFIKKLIDPRTDLPNERTFVTQKKIAAFMNTTQGLILIDSSDDFAIPLFSTDPSRYIITSDTDYYDLVAQYHRVDWIIVPAPSADTMAKNVIYKSFPQLASGALQYTNHHITIDSWHIYKVEIAKPSDTQDL